MQIKNPIDPRTPNLSRRSFVQRSMGAAALAVWSPVFSVLPASAAVTCAPPPNFPAGLPLYQQAFSTWSGEIQIEALWTTTPSVPEDVVTLANWAATNGYRLRPKGMSHNWSPLTVAKGSQCDIHVVLVDTTRFLTSIRIDAAASIVTAQTGITMENLLSRLEESNFGLTATPAPGDLTLGGVLAIDGHGTAVPAQGEKQAKGHTFGSVSNLIVSLTAVVWSNKSNQYTLKTFKRNSPAIRPLLVHVGRAFIVEVELRVGENQRLRCQSITNVPASNLFAPKGAAGNTMEKYLNETGRVEAIWFPFTENPWLKVWGVTPNKPVGSREVLAPFNYPFSDNIDKSVSDMLGLIIGGASWLTPAFGQLQKSIVDLGLVLTNSADLWGWSKNLLLYIRPTTLRVTANGYAILCSRNNVQKVINDFYVKYLGQVEQYQSQGRYPMNGPVEIRVTGLDYKQDAEVDGAVTAQLSALRPRPDRPEWDTAVWLDILSIPGTPFANQFYREMEQWVFSNYSGNYADVRVEWSKGWGYTIDAPWTSQTTIKRRIPESLTTGQATEKGFASAVDQLNQLDPFRIYSSPLLDAVFPAKSNTGGSFS